MNPIELKPGQQIRQGDVLFVCVEKRPSWAKEAPRDKHNRVLIAHGTLSGHGHAFRAKTTLGFRAQSPEMAALAGVDYVEIGGSFDTLNHEFADASWTHEHKPIAVSKAKLERAVQVDADEDGVRVVVD